MCLSWNVMKSTRNHVIDTLFTLQRRLDSRLRSERPNDCGYCLQSGRWATARAFVLAGAGRAGREWRAPGTRRDLPGGSCRSAGVGGSEARRANGRRGRRRRHDRRSRQRIDGHPSARLGVIPLGTANVLAHELGLPFSPKAVAAALAFGRTTTLWPGLASSAAGRPIVRPNAGRGIRRACRETSFVSDEEGCLARALTYCARWRN